MFSQNGSSLWQGHIRISTTWVMTKQLQEEAAAKGNRCNLHHQHLIVFWLTLLWMIPCEEHCCRISFQRVSTRSLSYGFHYAPKTLLNRCRSRGKVPWFHRSGLTKQLHKLMIWYLHTKNDRKDYPAGNAIHVLNSDWSWNIVITSTQEESLVFEAPNAASLVLIIWWWENSSTSLREIDPRPGQFIRFFITDWIIFTIMNSWQTSN